MSLMEKIPHLASSVSTILSRCIYHIVYTWSWIDAIEPNDMDQVHQYHTQK